jgi:Cdc6-like AAA superfamily ATPase
MGSEFLLPYQRELLARLATALQEVSEGANSQGLLLIGSSGAGKTHILDVVASGFRSSTVGYQRHVPCCRVAADMKATATSIACAILEQLGIPLKVSIGMKPKELEATVFTAIVACKVTLLILEELHNAILATSPQLRGQLSRFIKNLWNLTPVNSPHTWAHPDRERGDHRLVILASGTEQLRQAFDKKGEEELRSRFISRVEARKLSLDPPDSFRAFRGVLDAMIRRAGLDRTLSAADNEVAARALIACDGHLRVLENLLRRSATLEKRAAESIQPLELLARAFDEVGGGNSPESNPFRWPTAEIAARIKRARINQRLNNAEATGKPKP